MIEVLGYFFAALMGLILGVMGAGGSILTVPILVYCFHLPPVTATAFSLFVVGVTAGFGAFAHWGRKLIDMKTGLFFGVPAFIGVYCTRLFLVPNLPQVFSWGQWQISQDALIMGAFSVMMLLASYFMIRGRPKVEAAKAPLYHLVALQGLVVGLITGAIGVGGGFMVVPALIFLVGLEVKTAVGTTLFIVMIKSLFGFLGDIQSDLVINWSLLLSFTVAAVLGIQLGNILSLHVSGEKLKPLFGYFVLLMGIWIFFRDFISVI